jgi:hypothetical protein
MKRWFGLTAAIALVLVGAFLPWAKVPVLVGTAPGEATVTVWNGRVHYGELEVPHLFVLLAAAVSVAAYWLTASGWRNIPIPIPAGMALCGLVHTLCSVAILRGSRAGSIGPGSVLTAAGMLALLVLALRLPRPERPAVPRPRRAPGKRGRKGSRQRRS